MCQVSSFMCEVQLSCVSSSTFMCVKFMFHLESTRTKFPNEKPSDRQTLRQTDPDSPYRSQPQTVADLKRDLEFLSFAINDSSDIYDQFQNTIFIPIE